MSNYTITTDFGAKDSLPSSNDSKVVRGSEFTTEFTSIQTAIATKADTAGDTFTGVVNFSADVAVNTNTLFVDVSEAKVGIGTSSPAQALSVSAANNSQQITFGRTGSSVGHGTIGADSTGAFGIWNSADAKLVSVLQEGNVGIGTTSPASRLAIHGSADVAHIVQTNTANSQKLEIGNAYSLYTGASGSVSAIASDSTLAFATSDTERMRIDASGNVGIGTTSPDKKLHVKDGDVRIESDFPRLYFTDSGQNSDYSIINNNGKFSIYDDTNTTYRMAIDSSGDVTVGTNSKSSATTLKVENASGYAPSLEFNQSGVGAATISIPVNTNALQFNRYNGGTLNESMRIDSSGNVLVGTTSTAIAEATTETGIVLNNGGWYEGSRDGGTVGYFNRLSSDGEILSFRKDGTNVGSIGTVGGDMYLGTGARGIHISDGANSIVPCDATGGDSDATTSLGLAGARFKDLHLSGTGYFGTNVGIGTTSPVGDLTIGRNGNASGGNIMLGSATNATNKYGVITSQSYNSTTDTEGFAAIATQGISGTNLVAIGGGIGEVDSATQVRLYTSSATGTRTGTERMRIDSAGHVIIPEGITLGTTAGTYNASNTLDDYEEGTWTPVIYGSTGGTGSGTIVNAKYTKVGGLVQVMCYINSYDVTGLSGAVRLSGLPFNSNGYHISVIGYCNMFSTDEASVSVSGYTESGSDKIYLTKGSSTTLIPASEATNSSSQLMLNFTYATTS